MSEKEILAKLAKATCEGDEALAKQAAEEALAANIDIQKAISDDERVKFEWQANCFAGLILVPREELNTAINNAVADIDKHGISLNDNWDYAWDLIADNVGRAFTVSPGLKSIPVVLNVKE